MARRQRSASRRRAVAVRPCSGAAPSRAQLNSAQVTLMMKKEKLSGDVTPPIGLEYEFIRGPVLTHLTFNHRESLILEK